MPTNDDALTQETVEKLEKLLSVCFEKDDGYIAMLYEGEQLRLYPLTEDGVIDTKGSERIADRRIVQQVWELLQNPRGFGVSGRRILPLIIKIGGRIQVVKTLRWQTPHSWRRSFPSSAPRE